MTSHRKVAGLAMLLAITAAAQDQKVFRSDTRLVQVEVVVRDSKGPVEGLKQEDFQIFDNGKLQPIGAFSVIRSASIAAAGRKKAVLQASAPRNSSDGAQSEEHPSAATILLIDNLSTAFDDQVQSRHRMAEILNTLPPREPVAVYVVNQGLRVMTDFTDDPVRIAKALAQAGGELGQPPPSCDGDYEDRVPCAEYLGLAEIANRLASRPGRKNLIWVSNGFPVADPVRSNPILYFLMLRTVKELNQADIAVTPISAQGVAGPPAYSAQSRYAPPPGRNPSQGRSGLDGVYWADKTGGAPAMLNTDVGGALQRGLDAARVTYSLGFYPETLDRTYHELTVKVDRNGVDVSSRQGYLATSPKDFVLGRIAGEALESRAAGVDPGALDATIQLPYFYTGTNRARVHLSLDVVPTGMKFQKEQNKLHGQIEIVGTTARPDGESVARFAETVGVDMEDRQHADAFIHAPYHYEHQFLLAAGSYVFQMTIGAGPNAVGKVSVPLNIEPWSSTSFGIGGIAFSTGTRPVVAEPGADSKSLVAGGKEFVPAATNRFGKSDRVYFYTEVYEPALAAANPPSLTMEYRVFDAKTGELKQDSGLGGVGSYVQTGNPVVSFATTLPVAKLEPGLYRLEVGAGHSAGTEVVFRNVDFEVR